MQLRSALLAATVLATPIAASAQPVTGLYVGAGAGVNIMRRDIKNVNPDTDTSRSGLPTANLKRQHRVCRRGARSAGASATGCAPRSRATTATTTFNDLIGLRSVARRSMAATDRAEVRRHGQRAVRLQRRCRRGSCRTSASASATSGHQREVDVATRSTTLTRRTDVSSGFRTTGSHEGSFAYQAIVGAAFPLPAILLAWRRPLEYRFMGSREPQYTAMPSQRSARRQLPARRQS